MFGHPSFKKAFALVAIIALLATGVLTPVEQAAAHDLNPDVTYARFYRSGDRLYAYYCTKGGSHTISWGAYVSNPEQSHDKRWTDSRTYYWTGCATAYLASGVTSSETLYVAISAHKPGSYSKVAWWDLWSGAGYCDLYNQSAPYTIVRINHCEYAHQH